MSPEPTYITIAMTAGLLPALLLFWPYRHRLGRVKEPALNLLGGIGALLPVALTKLNLVATPLGIYAIAYFSLYFAGLLVFNWRQERISRL